MIFIAFAGKLTALERCDILGSLEADPLKKTLPVKFEDLKYLELIDCLLYTSPSPRDRTRSRMPSSA